MDCGERNPVSPARPSLVCIACSGQLDVENGRLAVIGSVVFLPVLLLRFLRDRALRGLKLPVFRTDFVLSVCNNPAQVGIKKGGRGRPPHTKFSNMPFRSVF